MVSTPIGDHALLSDLHTGPLISREGSVDWLCLPRFDSAAVFAAILGTEEHGRWLIAPRDGEVVDQHYEQGTFVLRTRWRTPTGEAESVDFMPSADGRADMVRRIRCLSGTIEVDVDLRLRPDYGATLPWVRRVDTRHGPCLQAVAGPDAYILRGPRLEADGTRHGGVFHLSAGRSCTWVLTWVPSHLEVPEPIDVDAALEDTRRFWTSWSDAITVDGPWADAVHRSLLVLRALTHADTGGIVAAPTTSLPEDPGGVRNWDYRFCWLRDSALTLEALLLHGRTESALHWRDWLLRAVAGDPEDLQIMYGIAGERSLPERTLPHLPGHLGSVPVRIGNGAVAQYQADVIGEVMIALEALREAGVAEDDFSWPLQRSMLRHVTTHLDRKDQGVWEMRGDAHYFTHSRVMMWAALDRGIRAVAEHGLSGPDAEWIRQRDALREEILEHGVSAQTGGFTQTYDTTEVDASLLQIPQTGFVPYDDPRMLATVEQIERDLMHHGLLLRYRTATSTDGLTGDEYPFLACSFWLVEQYARTGRLDEATALMEELVDCANPLGLLAEEHDPQQGRQMGNFPQAFSHLALVRAADAIRDAARER
ncbi:glycoside hydrolase family 15 protein [Brachybacterium phenoliresistens]|uniref:glycoside hydrolase family 15 protein n=1 Tax=Brachybacterium phenoliresistens TaxID=396014 RepID=UPI0031CEF30C